MTAAVQSRQQASPLLWVGLLGLVALIAIFALAGRNDPNIGGVADPDGVGPRGLLAARLFVEEAGGSTQRNVGLPGEDIDVAILHGFGDPFAPFSPDGDEPILSWQPLLDWVRDGGTLITTFDIPGAPQGGTGFVDGDLGELFVERGECTEPTLAGIQQVRPLDYVPVGRTAADTSCFGAADDAVVVIRPIGDGRVVRVATMALFFNRSFGAADNAAVFARLIEIDDEPTVGFLPDPPIWFILDEDAEIEIDVEEIGDNPPLERDADGNPIPFESGPGGFGGDVPLDEDGNPVGAGDQSLLDLIDPSVLAFIVGLTGAAALFALTVGRRHGSPVPEPIPIELPSSSYVDAVGRLYGKTENATARSSAILRHDLRTELARRVGMSADSSAKEIATALVAGNQQEAVVHMLDGPVPGSDDEFVALTVQLIETRDRVQRSGVANLAHSEDIALVTDTALVTERTS